MLRSCSRLIEFILHMGRQRNSMICTLAKRANCCSRQFAYQESRCQGCQISDMLDRRRKDSSQVEDDGRCYALKIHELCWPKPKPNDERCQKILKIFQNSNEKSRKIRSKFFICGTAESPSFNSSYSVQQSSQSRAGQVQIEKLKKVAEKRLSVIGHQPKSSAAKGEKLVGDDEKNECPKLTKRAKTEAGENLTVTQNKARELKKRC